MTYQDQIKEFRLPTYTPVAAVLGLFSEAGEVAGVFQKLIRGDYTEDQAAIKLHKELGDVLWHVAAIANDNNWTLEEIQTSNIEKLQSRKFKNTIMGSGDDR